MENSNRRVHLSHHTGVSPSRKKSGRAYTFAPRSFVGTGISPVGTANFLTYIHHSRHTQWLYIMRVLVLN